jgi:hypothetical protein
MVFLLLKSMMITVSKNLFEKIKKYDIIYIENKKGI